MPRDAILIRCSSCRALNNVPIARLKERPICGQCKTPLSFPSTPFGASSATLDKEISDWPEYVLVEFWAKWCGYCRIMEPVINDIASWRAGRLKVLKVDIDEQQDLARRFTIRATPTFVMYRNGRQIARLDGAPKEKIELVQWLDRMMSD